MKQFTVINEEFECQNCGHKNVKLKGGCRNHCTKCLHSLHLDEKFPGDRQSTCHELMTPQSVIQSKKKGWMIFHHCTKCDKIIPNKTASDDNFELIIKLSQNGHKPTGN